MTELEELEDIVGKLSGIEPFGIEPDFSSLGLEPAEVLGFQSEDELDSVISLLTMDLEKKPIFFKCQIISFINFMFNFYN